MSAQGDAYADFCGIVEKMRTYQKRYFKNHDSQALNMAKRYEEMVDRWLERRREEVDLLARLKSASESSGGKNEQAVLPGV